MSGYIGTQPVPQATQTRDVFTATSGQTTFATSGYTPNFLDVWLNGVKLVNGDDFTATNGSDVVLTSGAATGDTVEVLSYSTYEVNAQTYTGGLTVNNDAATVLTVDRATSDGTLVDFKKNGTSVGGVGTYSGFLNIANATNGLALGSTVIYPSDPSAGGTNGVVDLGGSGARFKDLYLSGGVYLGGTGAANLLDDYEEGTWTPSLNLDGTTTYNRFSNKYVKVGKQVTVWFAFTANTSTAQSGIGLYILGLPFSVASTGNNATYENGAVPILTERMYGTSAAASPHTFYAGAFAGTNQLNMFEGNYNGSLSNTSYFTTLIRSSVPLSANLYIVGQLTYTTT